MVLIKFVCGFMFEWGENCFLVENVIIIGDMVMGNDCSIWFQVVVCGDVNSICMGNKVNVQDGVVIYGIFEWVVIIIGNNVSIGYWVIVYGCIIYDNVFVGMGVIVMDNVVIEEYVLIVVGVVVLENQCCECGYIYVGVFVKKVKVLSVEQFGDMID